MALCPWEACSLLAQPDRPPRIMAAIIPAKPGSLSGFERASEEIEV